MNINININVTIQASEKADAVDEEQFKRDVGMMYYT